MIWSSMVRRCTNPRNKAFPAYGGRGITVCDRWRDFTNFLADMGECPEGLSIDRKDNDKGYEPGNCRWATQSEQCRNTRRNVILTLNGVSHCLVEWAEITGINYGTLNDRIRRGWSDADVLQTTPLPATGRHSQTHKAATDITVSEDR
jgi:hypothetical protein